MSRRMSCSMTIEGVRSRRKTVTRRHVDTWQALKPGDRLTLIEKGMGLPKGARQVVLAEVEIVSARVENLLGGLTPTEVAKEGFEAWSPWEFAVFWAAAHRYRPLLKAENIKQSPSPWVPPRPWRLDAICRALAEVECRRIEWRYLDEVDR